jgi:plasmid stabilization system protein ParE
MPRVLRRPRAMDDVLDVVRVLHASRDIESVFSGGE